MTRQDFGTATQAGARPIVPVLGDGLHGTIRAHRGRTDPARVSGAALEDPGFAAPARAHGSHAERVESTGDSAAAFGRARESKAGALLDIAVSPEAPMPRRILSRMHDTALAAKAKA